MTKVQPPPALGGRFAKDLFTIDLAADTVTCPGQVSVAIRPVKNGGGVAAFGTACAGCPRVAGRLARHPTQGGTQDRPSNATSPRRPTRTRPRHGQGRRRLLPARRRGQPGPVSACSVYDTPAEVGPPQPHDHRIPLLASSSAPRHHGHGIRRISPTRHQPPQQAQPQRHTTYPTKPVWHQPPSEASLGPPR